MFDIDDVLTLTALLPVVTMDTHTRTQTNTHTHTHARELQQQLARRCTAQLCAVWAPMHTMGTAILVNSSRKQKRGREREGCSTSQCPIGDHRGQCSGRVQLESLSAVCVLALYSDFLLARQRK